MEIKKIITKRKYKNWRSWQLVFEWEDIFKKELGASFVMNPNNGFHYRLGKTFGSFYDSLPISKFWPWPSFLYEMLTTERVTPHCNSSRIIPCIIDWYLKTPEELRDFFKHYSNHKLILVTSKEVFDYLSLIDTPIPFGHLPLSISDKYRITPDTIFEKDLDVVLMGRQNPVLLEWLARYSESHPEITIVSSKREKDNYNYYTQDGKFVANAVGRNQCMDLLRRSKVSLYSTKGMDDDYTFFNLNGFSQVTPRLFESMATGNHVIARYKENADTDFYQLNTIFPHTDSYESFKKQMDIALVQPVDMRAYSNYLEKHYTSTRVKLLKDLVQPL